MDRKAVILQVNFGSVRMRADLLIGFTENIDNKLVIKINIFLHDKCDLYDLSAALIHFLCFSVCRPFDAKNPFLAPVTVNRRLNKAGDRHLMHLELDITGSKIR